MESLSRNRKSPAVASARRRTGATLWHREIEAPGNVVTRIEFSGRRTKGLLMAYKLRDLAPARWRPLSDAHLLPLVRAGIGFMDGVQQEAPGGRQPSAI